MHSERHLECHSNAVRSAILNTRTAQRLHRSPSLERVSPRRIGGVRWGTACNTVPFPMQFGPTKGKITSNTLCKLSLRRDRIRHGHRPENSKTTPTSLLKAFWPNEATVHSYVLSTRIPEVPINSSTLEIRRNGNAIQNITSCTIPSMARNLGNYIDD